MFGGNPFYRSAPNNNSGGYYPYGHAQQPIPQNNPFYPYQPPHQTHDARRAEYERDLERQRRAQQYLPDEYDAEARYSQPPDDYDAYDYGFGRNPNLWERDRSRTRSQEPHHSIPIQTPPAPPRMPEPHAFQPPASRSEQLHPEYAYAQSRQNGNAVPPRKSPSPSRTSASPRPNPQVAPSSSSSSSPSPAPTAIDSHTQHVQDSLSAIANVEAKFHDLKKAFAWPSRIDFDCNGEIISLPIDGSESQPRPPAKLAYTTTNKPIHAYNEMLNRLLVNLDAIESWGEPSVRERRRGVVSTVEAEAGRLERGWKRVWEGRSAEQEEEGEVKAILTASETQ